MTGGPWVPYYQITMATPTSKMTPDEISTLVGAGPYAVVRVVDTAKGGQPSTCALCGSGLCKAIVFSNGLGREFSAGVDCAQWIPGKRRAVAQAKRELEAARKAGRKVTLPTLPPGVHWYGFDAVVVSTSGVEYRGTMDTSGYPTLIISGHGAKIVRKGSMDEFEAAIVAWVEGL